ncbi:MAG TPA: NAD-dependent epimerase/dehydratase family protein [bacterium]|nr:NAD-dependent epimerase/dehydratase family protein [bacterium]
MENKIFITGASGYIGGRLVEKLVKSGYETVALSRSGTQKFFSEKGNPVVKKGDITDFDSLVESMKGCSSVFHLAAHISFNRSEKDLLFKINTEGTENVFKAALVNGIKRAVFVSSACVFGISKKNVTIDENFGFDESLVFHNLYLASKKKAEAAAEEYNKKGMDIIIANPVTVFGPGDDSMNSGTIIKAALSKKIAPVPPGGTSWVDVDDVASALILLMKNGRKGERYIVSSGNITFYDLFKTICEAGNKRSFLIKIPDFIKAPAIAATSALCGLSGFFKYKNKLLTPQIIEDSFSYKYYSSEKLKKETGWINEYDLRQSVERALKYYKSKGLL